jgi:hypothetical protein
VLEQVEHGERLGSVEAELGARWGANAPRVAFRVERIRFVTPEEAAVRFTISALPQQMFDGRVVRVGGSWKIGYETYCMVAALGGVRCPDVDDEHEWTADPDDDDAA